MIVRLLKQLRTLAGEVIEAGTVKTAVYSPLTGLNDKSIGVVVEEGLEAPVTLLQGEYEIIKDNE